MTHRKKEQRLVKQQSLKKTHRKGPPPPKPPRPSRQHRVTKNGASPQGDCDVTLLYPIPVLYLCIGAHLSFLLGRHLWSSDLRPKDLEGFTHRI
jgi:hypothetical protein